MLRIVNYCSASRPTYRGSLVKLNTKLVSQVMKSRVSFSWPGESQIPKRGILEILVSSKCRLEYKTHGRISANVICKCFCRPQIQGLYHNIRIMCLLATSHIRRLFLRTRGDIYGCFVAPKPAIVQGEVGASGSVTSPERNRSVVTGEK